MNIRTLLALAALAVCTTTYAESTPSAPTELVKIDLQEAGEGAEASAGKQVSVHYTGWLYDATAPKQRGAKFDSSRDRGQPITFVLGTRRVISGWDMGLEGMQVGGQRTLIIPPHLAYGTQARGPIPANATLIFDVELVDVK
ncbi:MAG: FKBP-type peptidyl-prolyl cis-trans isomerase [Gammaproteobacteria bacterium]|nr:FKBP-type peptidyl-prolyl cis-trans isomerase [Gammaproteobacteria bacterium]